MIMLISKKNVRRSMFHQIQNHYWIDKKKDEKEMSRNAEIK